LEFYNANHKQEKAAPFSMRLTKSEYEQLKRPSAGLSMSACTPLRLFGHNEAKRGTRGKFPVKDQQAHRQY